MTNAKPPRSDDDVRKLAAAWASKWVPTDGIEPWLRRHMDEMQRMVRVDRWSWRDLARSLNEAGITYAGGQWTAALLGDKVAGLRSRQRKAERKVPSHHGFPVEALREVLGNLGSIGHLTVNIQAAPSGPMTATVAGQTAMAPTVPASPAPMPAKVASPTPMVEQVIGQTGDVPATPDSSAEPPRRTFGYATPRGLDPAAKAPGPLPTPPSKPEPATPAAPAVDADDVLARFAPGTTQR